MFTEKRKKEKKKNPTPFTDQTNSSVAKDIYSAKVIYIFTK